MYLVRKPRSLLTFILGSHTTHKAWNVTKSFLSVKKMLIYSKD